MPTVHREDGFRFAWYANEGNEPPHVHVIKGDAVAKYWLEPIREVYNRGFSPAECRRIGVILREQQVILLEQWHDFFATDN